MIIHILSDIHLEFGPLDEPFSEKALKADLRLLAGDIGLGPQGCAWALENFETPTAYVFGNHEHYDGPPIDLGIAKARALCAGTHLSVLDKHQMLLIPGARILGASLWTGFDLFETSSRNKESIEQSHFRMSDYRKISSGYRHGHDQEGAPLPGPARADGSPSPDPRVALTPYDTVAYHRSALAWLQTRLNEPFDGKTIVLTHHAPHQNSLLHQQPSTLIDGAYASNLQELMRLNHIDLWVHGHTHVPCDYLVGNTRVVSNPRGYSPNALVDGFDINFTVEL